MERTVIMDKSKGEPVISVKTTSRSKERVSIASATSNPVIFDHFGLHCENIVWSLKFLELNLGRVAQLVSVVLIRQR